jgi:hypothetical protein
MDIGHLGLIMIVVGLLGAAIMGWSSRRRQHKSVITFESLYDHERLEQLIRISGGGSLEQIVRLYNIHGRELEKARKGEDCFFKIRGLVRDRILLSQEINRLTSIEDEKENQLLISRSSIFRKETV